MGKISRTTRDELVRITRERYAGSGPEEKGRILDEFSKLTGFHRKHAIRVLNGGGPASSPVAPARTVRARVYDEAVREAMTVLWEASDRICGKRLRPLLPTLLAALERHGHLKLDEVVRARVVAASAATIDRMLARARAGGGKRSRSSKPAVRRAIPVRTFADWKDPVAGYFEMDLVAHCGGSLQGSFAHTLVLTDIATGWTECLPLLVREGGLIVEALEQLRPVMPLPMLGLDTDNGSEFVNDQLVACCARLGVELTRSRPYRKNDQAWVEQKNGAIVRRLVGYGRPEGIAGVAALSRLYGASRLFVNFFQPSFKLAEKHREGARAPQALSLARDSVRTPPLVRHGARSDEGEAASCRGHARPAPTARRDPHRAASHRRPRVGHARARAPSPGCRLGQIPEKPRENLDRGGGAADAPTRAAPRAPLANAARPVRGGVAARRALARGRAGADGEGTSGQLQLDRAAGFENGQLRTLQRRVKAWRRAAARRLLFAPDAPPLAPDRSPT